MSQLFLGIDPGQSGAYAIVDEGGALVEVGDLPVLASEPLVLDVVALLEARSSKPMVAIEEPFANRSASSISQMNQGIFYGMMLGIIQTLELPLERIRPQHWKSEMGVPMGSKYTPKEKKELSRKRATDLWPESQQRWSRQKDHDRAEAALIAECLRRRVVGA